MDSQHHPEGIEGSTSFLFRRVILIYFLGIFLGPKTDFVVGFPVNAEQPA